MSQQVVVIHGGEVFDSYDAFLADLQHGPFDLERYRAGKRGWKSTLEAELGDGFFVYTPSMPNRDNAKYAEWKMRFERMLPSLSPGVILIGHSLGGMFLAKLMAEASMPVPVRATFLVAAPFQGVGDFVLPDRLEQFAAQAGNVFIYHSADDAVVPFAEGEQYRDALPGAVFRSCDGRGHFNGETFPELATDVRLMRR